MAGGRSYGASVRTEQIRPDPESVLGIGVEVLQPGALEHVVGDLGRIARRRHHGWLEEMNAAQKAARFDPPDNVSFESQADSAPLSTPYGCRGIARRRRDQLAPKRPQTAQCARSRFPSVRLQQLGHLPAV